LAKGKKTGGRDIQPGQVLNPYGRPKLSDDIRLARSADKLELERIIRKYLNMPPGEMKRVVEFEINNPDTEINNLEIMIAKMIVEIINKADQFKLEFLLNRLIGPVKHKIEAEILNPLMGLINKTPPHLLDNEIDDLIERKRMIDEELNEPETTEAEIVTDSTENES